MKRVIMGMAVLALTVACIGSASAQGGRRFGMMGRGGLQLLGIPEVQQELKMTPAQIEKLPAKQEELRQAMQELRQQGQPGSPEEGQKRMEKMRELQDKAVTDILDTTQKKRFRQLELQQQGPIALGRKDVADELKLTEEQRRKVAGLQQQANSEMQGMMQGVDFQNMSQDERQNLMRKMQDMQKATGEKIAAVLNDDQRATWKAMQGEPFKFPEFRPRQRP
jgi:hypothetical protein